MWAGEKAGLWDWIVWLDNWTGIWNCDQKCLELCWHGMYWNPCHCSLLLVLWRSYVRPCGRSQ